MKVWIFAAIFGLSLNAWAQDAVKVEDAWVRATVSTQKATGAFMRLTASGQARLVAAQSPIAGVVEIHEMAMDKDVTRMRAVAGLELGPGKAVELKPGGYHIMLMDLKQVIKPGDAVPLSLTFEDAQKKRSTQLVSAQVRALAPTPMGGATGVEPHGAHKH